MKLRSAKIINYRSIENVKIQFDYNTKVFVGLSETGKSNLLKALNTLSPLAKTSARDIREDIESDDESYIEFLLYLDNNDKENIKKLIEDKCYHVNFDKILLDKEKKNIKIDYFLDRDYIYKVNVIKGTKYYQYYTINQDKYNLNGNFMFLEGNEEDFIKFEADTVEIKQKTLYGNENNDVIEDNVKIKKVTLETLNEFISDIIIQYLKNQKWNVLFWKYEEKNILPSEIKTEDFVNNPNCCLPLKKLFELYGI